MGDELLWLAIIGVFGQLLAALTGAYFAFVAARKLAATLAELNHNTKLTESVKNTTEDTNRVVKNGNNNGAFPTRDWCQPGSSND